MSSAGEVWDQQRSQQRRPSPATCPPAAVTRLPDPLPGVNGFDDGVNGSSPRNRIGSDDGLELELELKGKTELKVKKMKRNKILCTTLHYSIQY